MFHCGNMVPQECWYDDAVMEASASNQLYGAMAWLMVVVVAGGDAAQGEPIRNRLESTRNGFEQNGLHLNPYHIFFFVFLLFTRVRRQNWYTHELAQLSPHNCDTEASELN